MPRTPSSLSGLDFGISPTVGGEVTVPNVASLQNLTSLTIEGWIYLKGQTPNNGYLWNMQAGNNGYFLAINPSNKVTFACGNGTAVSNVSSAATVGVNNGWHHIAATWDGSNMRVFIDGVLGNTLALSGGNTGNPGIGANIGNTGSGTRALPGTLSDLCISNTARYTASFTPPTQPFTPDANTIGLYHLNEGQGTVAQDSSSQANHGTLSGSPLPTWSAGKFFGQVGSRSAASNRMSIQNMLCSLVCLNNNAVSITSGPLANNVAQTVAVWVKLPSNPSGNNLIQSYDTSSVVQNNLLVTNGGQLRLELESTVAGMRYFTNVAKMPYNQWALVGYTMSAINLTAARVASDADVWLNGLKATTGTAAIGTAAATTVNEFSVACQRPGVSPMIGLVGPVYLFNRILNAQEWQNLYNGVLPSDSSNSLVLNWPLNEGTGTTAYDKSGNGNNGTITSGTYTSDTPTKTRQLVGGNLVYNGNFEFAPPTNVACTSSGKWLDGTSGGAATNALFGWATNTGAGSNSFIFDNSTSHSGNYSLKVSTTAVGSTCFAENNVGTSLNALPVLPSTAYTLSFWMKTTANSGSATTGAQVIAHERNGSFGGVTTTASPGITTTTGWTQYTINFTTNSATRYLIVKLAVTGNDGTGTLILDANFDDITLTPTTNATRSLAT